MAWRRGTRQDPTISGTILTSVSCRSAPPQHTIGALPIAGPWTAAATFAYQPGLTTRKATDLDPGSPKRTRDAFIITARAMRHRPRAVGRDSEVLAALKVLPGFDAELTHECTRATNRLLSMLLKYTGPTGLRTAGRPNVLRWTRHHSRKNPVNLVDSISMALGEETVTVTGTEGVDLAVPRAAAHPRSSSPAGHRGRSSRRAPR